MLDNSNNHHIIFIAQLLRRESKRALDGILNVNLICNHWRRYVGG